MTYICKKGTKYYVYEVKHIEIVALLDNCFDSYFEVDTLIASSIALLNEKGYETEMSCSEHYHHYLQLNDPCYKNEIPKHTIFYQKNDDDMFECCCICNHNISNSFVRFRMPYSFNSLPNGWSLSDGCYLSYKYDINLKEYEFYQQQIEALSVLHNWVQKLPNYIRNAGKD